MPAIGLALLWLRVWFTSVLPPAVVTNPPQFPVGSRAQSCSFTGEAIEPPDMLPRSIVVSLSSESYPYSSSSPAASVLSRLTRLELRS
jgi:hypothetical protein